ncbi:MAG: tRNA lysidine(34) synthetase TilS [Candidatus Microsaccharimonas sp.]
MTYIVGVSGGVDSVVLLDLLVKRYGDTAAQHLIVAHFDHGIRPDSSDDAKFVRKLAKNYGLRYEQGNAKLGSKAGEALARTHRYDFLQNITSKYDNAAIITAHHLDDLVETVALNFERGTGWRGLAVFGADVQRPLLRMTKSELIQYAEKHNLVWREDSTNQSDAYLRNRLRPRTIRLPHDTKRQLHALYARQHELASEIAHEARKLVGDGPVYDRYFFIHAPQSVALECLRIITKGEITRPQVQRLLHAIKVAQPNNVFEAGSGTKVYFSTRQFSFQLIKL